MKPKHLGDSVKLESKKWRKWDEWRGHYSFGDGSVIQWKNTNIECPYCFGTLQEANRAMIVGLGRIAWVDDARKTDKEVPAIVSRIPPTHILLYCCYCDQKYTSIVHSTKEYGAAL